MLDRLTFWRLYDAMSIPARPGHDCLGADHDSLECAYIESMQSIRDAAGDLLMVLQGVQA